MRLRIALLMFGLLAAVATVSCSNGSGANDADGDKLRVAVVTGEHAFDVPNFYRLFRELPGVDAYPQHIEHFASSSEEIRDAYDVVVFYGMGRDAVPVDEGPQTDYAGEPKAAIERLAERGQGVVIMHHALLAWTQWDLWNELCGFDDRNFGFKEGIDLKIEIADDKHAITKGLDPFEIHDEGYTLHGKHDGKGTVLLTVDHERAMDEVAWVRQQGKSNVFCLALGHDDKAWTNPAFRDLLRRGIKWSADE
ncbi:MAG: ThuA domain-containing protein [Candidatus Nealsonbacteria bacterium]|nr:ThuA domain-containing protein [Candidatus Nealsonbacteria bacterium]